MGLRGPQPKPRAVKIAEGNRGHRPLRDDSPQFDIGEPQMPAGLSMEAAELWLEIVPLLMGVPGLLTVADGWALGNLCEVRARRLALSREIAGKEKKIADELRTKRAVAVKFLKAHRKPGKVSDEVAAEIAKARALTALTADQIAGEAREAVRNFRTATGYVALRPEVNLLRSLREEENKLMRQFGLDPSSRGALRISTDGAAGHQQWDAIDEAFFGSRPVAEIQ